MRVKRFIFTTLLLVISLFGFTISSTYALETESDWFESSGYMYYVGEIPDTVNEIISIGFDPAYQYEYAQTSASTHTPIPANTTGLKLIQEIDMSFNVTYSMVLYPSNTYVKTSSTNTPETWGSISIRREVEDFSPVISGQTTFVTTVDNPISVSTITSYLSAYDETDGNLTHLITVDQDNYTANNSTIGTHSIVYSVSDSAGNVATLTVSVLVKDMLAPTWNESNNSASVSYTQTFNLDAYKSQLGVNDNYYAPQDITITIDTNNYTANKTVPGTYEVVYELEDPSGNLSYASVDITVFDDVDPVFSGPSVISKSSTQALTLSEIKSELTANDAIDGNLTSSIQVVSDNYTGFGNIVGTYNVEFSVTDNSGNIAYHTVSVDVYDNLPPVFYVKDGYFVSVENSVLLTRQDFIDILEITGQISVDGTGGIQIYTLLNEYEGNESTPGIYALSFKVVTVSGNESIYNMAVEVMEDNTDQVDVIDEPTLGDDVLTFIKDNVNYIIFGITFIVLGVFGFVWIKKASRKHKKSKSKRK